MHDTHDDFEGAKTEQPEPNAFERIVTADAVDVARRTRKSKFGKLSNFRILRLLRQAANDEPSLRDASDSVLLDRWFEAYGRAVQDLRERH